MNRRTVLLALAGVSLVLMSGSGAFTSMSAERGVDISVVEDDRAYLAINSSEALQCGEMNTVIQNQFSVALDSVVLDITLPREADANTTVEVVSSGSETMELEPGESRELAFGDGPYDPGESLGLRLELKEGQAPDHIDIEVVEATGSGIKVSTDVRQFDVSNNCGTGS
jgi:hypothetical protein